MDRAHNRASVARPSSRATASAIHDLSSARLTERYTSVATDRPSTRADTRATAPAGSGHVNVPSSTPLSTIDLATPSGDEIPIEQRSPKEVTHLGATRLAPEGASVWNPAFDVTPARLVAGIITERGIARAPYADSLRALFDAAPAAV